MRNLLGHCEIISAESGIKILFVSQQIGLDQKKQVVHVCKKFTLDSIDGVELSPTEDPNIFLHQDGTSYKRISPFRQGAPPQSRRHMQHRL